MTWKKFSLEQAAARFDKSEDLTIGIEEEFQIIDAGTRELANRFEDLYKIAHPLLGTNVCGELIASEIEINSHKSYSLRAAEADLKRNRGALLGAAREAGLGLAASGTHPFSDWREQRIVSTHHYQEVEERLRYCAWRNLTYGMHVHVGIQGRERMIAVFNAIRGYLPYALALSANSPFAEGYYTYLHSTRAQIFTRSFPRCNIPGAFNDWNDYASFIDLLFRTHSITDPMQVWWSVRPHPWLGTVEMRICDCQSDLSETMAVASLLVALMAQLMADHDNGIKLPVLSTNQIEENVWRATRYGMDGGLIDYASGEEVPAPEAIRKLVDYTSERWSQLGASQYLEKLYAILKEGNGAQRQIGVYEQTGDVKAVFADVVARSRFDYSEA